MRKFLGVVVGIVVAMLTITLVEFVGHAVYPPPPGLDLTTPEAMATYVTALPVGAMLFIVAAWFLGALVGGWTALRISGWAVATWIVAAVIAAGGIYNATQIPAPLWMQLSTVLAPALGGWAALHIRWRRAA